MKLSEQQIRLGIVGTGIGCCAVLLTLEIATESDRLSFADVAGDALTILLATGAATGVALLWRRVRTPKEEDPDRIRASESARLDHETR